MTATEYLIYRKASGAEAEWQPIATISVSGDKTEARVIETTATEEDKARVRMWAEAL